MKARRNTPIASCSNSSPSLHIIIVYEDYLTGNRALRTCERLIQQFRPDTHCDTTSWKFELLRSAKLRKMATEEAVAADMIIVSAHGDSDLPLEIKSWMDSWLHIKRGSDSALVALLHCSNPAAPQQGPADAYLKEAARKAKLDYFCHFFEEDEDLDVAQEFYPEE
jgi:hypothetical protein